MSEPPPAGDAVAAKEQDERRNFAEAMAWDDRLLKVTVQKKKGKIGWVRDVATLRVDEVAPGGAAEQAGVKPGMKIVEVNGEMVESDEDCTRALAAAADNFTLVLDTAEMYDENYKVTLSKEAIERARAMTLEEQVLADERTTNGVDLFMKNEYLAAEKIFEESAETDPLAGGAWTLVAVLRALMSFEEKDMKEARRRISLAQQVSSQIAPAEGVASSVKNLLGLGSASKPPITNSQLRAKVTHTDVSILRAMLYLTEDSVFSWLRASLGLRKGYADVESLAKQVSHAVKQYVKSGKKLAPGQSPGAGKPPNAACAPREGDQPGQWGSEVYDLFEYNTIAGIHFGLGAINLSLSAMPQKVLTLLSMFGFMCDRDIGYENLTYAYLSDGARSVPAAAVLLVYRGILPSFASALIPSSLPEAEKLVETLLSMHKDFAVYLWAAGRVSRLKRDLASAVSYLEASLTNGNKIEFPQLAHLSYYELAWTHCFALDWEKAVRYFKMLHAESTWSKIFYAYCVGVCHHELGSDEEAKVWLLRTAEVSGKRFGGKTISVEQYIARKVSVWTRAGFAKESMGLPGIELIMHFNAFCQMPMDNLRTVLDTVQTQLNHRQAKYNDSYFRSQPEAKLPYEAEMVVCMELMRANCLRELGKVDEARKTYCTIEERHPNKAWKKQFSEETWALPFAQYDHALLCLSEGEPDAAVKHLQAAEKYKDFNFEMPLALRIHLTRDHIGHKKKEQETERKSSKPDDGKDKKKWWDIRR
ncbi:hypothetical protein DIPPA_29149 [Diplonema papillatum]|nr:hypothetical protein DIPPA_29149 [Diplonema papillatum]